MHSHPFWAAVSTIGAGQYERDSLDPGEHPLTASISGTLGRRKISPQRFDGRLIVNPPAKRVREIPPRTVDIVAALLYALSPRTRRQVLAELSPRALASDEATQRLAAELIAAAKVPKTETARGAITFVPRS